MILRKVHEQVGDLLSTFPCVAIIGPRQVGKTTLAKTLQPVAGKETMYLDLELQKDFDKLSDAETFLSQFAGSTIIIDEVQRNKKLFPVLRALIDQNNVPGRFLLLGSAGPDLIRDSSESLAGRIAYIELTPFLIPEIIPQFSIEQLWVKGGFPVALLGKPEWSVWMDNFIRTYLEKDLPMLGFPADRITAGRLWSMTAHIHGNLVNYSEIGKSLEVSMNTVKKYLGFLEQAFLVRQLQPYSFNIKKRIVKSPKIYIRDTGILHFLLGISNLKDLFGSHKIGASWEGFIIEQVNAFLPSGRKLYFYRTHDGSELDLVIEKGGKPLAGIEIKFGSDIKLTKGNIMAAEALQTKHNFIITKESEDYLNSAGFRICGISTFLEKYLPQL